MLLMVCYWASLPNSVLTDRVLSHIRHHDGFYTPETSKSKKPRHPPTPLGETVFKHDQHAITGCQHRKMRDPRGRQRLCQANSFLPITGEECWSHAFSGMQNATSKHSQRKSEERDGETALDPAMPEARKTCCTVFTAVRLA